MSTVKFPNVCPSIVCSELSLGTWNTEEKEASDARPAEFVVGNEDDDESEELEEIRKVTVGRPPT